MIQELVDENNYPLFEGVINLAKEKQMEKEQIKERIGQFMNWFIKHYSTATIDGMFGWVDSMEKEVTLKEILDHYYDYDK
jgi:NADH dehydrogenase FAD-containing subunit